MINITIYVYYFNQKNNPKRYLKTYTHIKHYYDIFFKDKYEQVLKNANVNIVSVNDCDPDKQMNKTDYFYVHMCSNRMNFKNIIKFANRVPYENRVLYLYDSPLSKQHKWEFELFHYFGKVLTNYREFADNKKYFWVPPFSRHSDTIKPIVTKKSEKNNLYAMQPFTSCVNKHRVELAMNLGERFHVHIYGNNQYFKKLHKSVYKGPIERELSEKIKTFGQYKFVISMEPLNQEFYISEYFTEPLYYDNVLVYYGSKNINMIFKDIFDGGIINGYDFKNTYEMTQFLKNMTKDEYAKRLKKIRDHREDVLNILSINNVFRYIFGKMVFTSINNKKTIEECFLDDINKVIYDKTTTVQIIYKKDDYEYTSYMQRLSLELVKMGYKVIDHLTKCMAEVDIILTNDLLLQKQHKKRIAFFLFDPNIIQFVYKYLDTFAYIIPVNKLLNQRLLQWYDDNKGDADITLLRSKMPSVINIINIPCMVFKTSSMEIPWSKDLKNYGLLFVNNTLGRSLAFKLREYNQIIVDKDDLHNYFVESRVFVNTLKDDYNGNIVFDCIDKRCLPLVSDKNAISDLHYRYVVDNYYDIDQWINKTMFLLSSCLTTIIPPVINKDLPKSELNVLLNMEKYSYNPVKNS